MIIHSIWNDAREFRIGEGMSGSSPTIIGSWGVCVVIGVVLCSYCWIASLVCSFTSTSGELSDCMGWRRGESCLGHLFFVVLLFLLSRVWEYHSSDGVSLGGLPPSEVGWAPSEVICPPSEVFVVRFWTGAYIIPGVLDSVPR